MTDDYEGSPADATAADSTTGRSTALPASLRLGHVRLQVDDLARSLDYYTTVLGLEP